MHWNTAPARAHTRSVLKEMCVGDPTPSSTRTSFGTRDTQLAGNVKRATDSFCEDICRYRRK